MGMNENSSRVSSAAIGCNVFVAHVKRGYEERAAHIEKMLGGMGVGFKYMLDGDICDFTPELIGRYFKNGGLEWPAQTSCTLKHVLIYEEIVKQGLDGALVLEDDICLHKNFAEVFNQSIKELREMQCADNQCVRGGVIISYEDTRLRFVERSRRKKGKVLYAGDRDRMAGCYYVDRAGAELMLRQIGESGGLGMPIDLYHAWMLRHGGLSYLWCQPTVATQGSHNGLFMSMLNTTKGRFEVPLWKMKRAYKKLLYWFR